MAPRNLMSRLSKHSYVPLRISSPRIEITRNPFESAGRQAKVDKIKAFFAYHKWSHRLVNQMTPEDWARTMLEANIKAPSARTALMVLEQMKEEERVRKEAVRKENEKKEHPYRSSE